MAELWKSFDVPKDTLTETWDGDGDWLQITHVEPMVELWKKTWTFEHYTVSYNDSPARDCITFTVTAVNPVLKFGSNECHNCGKNIKVAIFRGSGVCSDNCRKALGEDIK